MCNDQSAKLCSLTLIFSTLCVVHDLIQGKRLSIAFVYFVGPASVTTYLVYATF